MWQAQRKKDERKKRRKDLHLCRQILGHTVKSCMTVIRNDVALSDGKYFIVVGAQTGCVPIFYAQGRTEEFVVCATCAPRGERGKSHLLDFIYF